MIPRLRRIASGLLAWLRHSRVEADLDAELREFFETGVEQKMRTGLDRAAAARALRHEMGSIESVKHRVRDAGIEAAIGAFVADLRYATRTSRRAPGFTTVAVGSSALGIGACSLIFAIVNAALLSPLPVEEPNRLMRLSESDRRTGEAGNELSYPDYRDLRNARSFDGIAAYDPMLTASLGTPGDPHRRVGTLATANYFSVVQPRFVLGRGFDAERDDTAGSPLVVVLSHDLWRRQFGGDPGIVGRTVSINTQPATVVGVTAVGFRGTDAGIASEFWVPLAMLAGDEESRLEVRGRHWLASVGRLRHGVDVRSARAELDVIATTLNASFRDDQARGFHVERAGQLDVRLRGMASTLFAVCLAAAVVVLLAACANIANLLLGRASIRRQEVAVRMALGASRGRLVRQLLTESLVLALLGGFAGWIMAAYGAVLMGRVRIPLPLPLDTSISLDYRVLLFCIALSLVTSAAFGLMPALRATRPDLIADARTGARGSATADGSRLRSGLVVTQIAICTLLLLCTGLFLRSLHAARAIDVGVEARHRLLLAFDPSLDHRTEADARQLLGDILERAQHVAGVESATLTTAVPLTFIIDNSQFVAESRGPHSTSPPVGADIYAVGPQFFETMGLSFVAGEDFSQARASASRELEALLSQGESVTTDVRAIVNDAFARAMFPDRAAVGQRFAGDGMALEIAGVVATAKSRTVGEAPRPVVYLPLLSTYTTRARRGVTLVARTQDAPTAYVGPLRAAIREVEPSLAVFDVRTMDDHVRDALLVPRLAGALSAIAGSVGLAIAIIGVYGIISFSVARRRREIGIRLAIGARPRAMLAMVLRQGVRLAAVGAVLGLAAGWGATRFAASLLYGVTPTDTLTFVAVPLLLTGVALLACLVPARAAARVNPADVLRSE